MTIAMTSAEYQRERRYVFQYDPEWSGGRGGVTVTDSFDLQQTIKVRGPGGGGDAEEQRCARQSHLPFLLMLEIRCKRAMPMRESRSDVAAQHSNPFFPG